MSLVLSRGDAGTGGVPNTTFTTQPVLWNPVPGEEILVVAGKAHKSAFIVAFYRLPGDRYRIASSFVSEGREAADRPGLATGYVRRRMTWSLCWDCRGKPASWTLPRRQPGGDHPEVTRGSHVIA